MTAAAVHYVGRSVESTVKDIGLYALPVLATIGIAVVVAHRRLTKRHEPA
jgi:hypothetical protein